MRKRESLYYRLPMQRPPWWEWDLELTSHLLRRMLNRGFNEVDLREMLEAAHRLQPDVEEGRFIVATRHDGAAWRLSLSLTTSERFRSS